MWDLSTGKQSAVLEVSVRVEGEGAPPHHLHTYRGATCSGWEVFTPWIQGEGQCVMVVGREQEGGDDGEGMGMRRGGGRARGRGHARGGGGL